MSAVDQPGLEDGGSRPVDRLERGSARAQLAIHRQQQPLSDSAMGAGEGTGVHDPGPLRPSGSSRLAPALWLHAAVTGNTRR